MTRRLQIGSGALRNVTFIRNIALSDFFAFLVIRRFATFPAMAAPPDFSHARILMIVIAFVVTVTLFIPLVRKLVDCVNPLSDSFLFVQTFLHA